MATKIVEMKDVQQDAKASSGPQFVFLFELEGVAVSGRRAAFDALKSLLKENSIELSPAHFSRYCLHASPELYVDGLLEGIGAGKLSSSKLVEDVRNGIAMQLSSKETSLHSGIDSLMNEAKSQGIGVACFSGLPAQTANSVAEKVGLSAKGVQLFIEEKVEKSFPRADFLLKTAKALSISPRYCVVVGSSQSTCKAALSAGMRCIVVPDEFTSFQDFGGAEEVIDDFGDVNLKDLINDLCPDLGAPMAKAEAVSADAGA